MRGRKRKRRRTGIPAKMEERRRRKADRKNPKLQTLKICSEVCNTCFTGTYYNYIHTHKLHMNTRCMYMHYIIVANNYRVCMYMCVLNVYACVCF